MLSKPLSDLSDKVCVGAVADTFAASLGNPKKVQGLWRVILGLYPHRSVLNVSVAL